MTSVTRGVCADGSHKDLPHRYDMLTLALENMWGEAIRNRFVDDLESRQPASVDPLNDSCADEFHAHLHRSREAIVAALADVWGPETRDRFLGELAAHDHWLFRSG